jgi:serine/threonine-protein kinase
MDLPVGTVLGEHYRITRLIGVGGMGAIYEASHLGAGKRVAVKLMSKQLAAHPEALARFRREVKVTTELAHPHIVDVFDFGESPTGEPYLVMEFLDGEDLGHRLEREGSVPLAVAVQIIKQVASALSVAHAEGVVHRDLKPDNVFLLRVADGEVFVKIVDFGISKVLKATTTKLTVARAVVGTPEFMAPEQASGRIDWIDHRTDQWALAVLAWHMLSGRLPFWKPEVNLILTQVISEDPTPLHPDLAPLIPREVDKVLRRALSKKREDRFPTINAFARAFEAAATGKPARQSGRAEALQETPQKQERQQPKQPKQAQRQRPRAKGRGGLWLSVGVLGLALAGAAWVFRDELPIPKWWPGESSRGARPAGGPTVEPAGDHDGDRARRRAQPQQRR